MCRPLDSEPGDDETVRSLLLDYLLASSAVVWPGGDGLTEDDVLRFYPEAIRIYDAPGRDELCRRHPDLSSAIAAYFSLRGWNFCQQSGSNM